MSGPPPFDPIHTFALIVCPPAPRVTCAPFAKVGHVPFAVGSIGGVVPASLDTPPLLLPDPLELEDPLLDPEPPPDPLELLAPASLPEPEEPLELPEPEELPPLDPLPPPELPPPFPAEDADEPLQPAASAIPRTPSPRLLRMAAQSVRAGRTRATASRRRSARETQQIRLSTGCVSFHGTPATRGAKRHAAPGLSGGICRPRSCCVGAQSSRGLRTTTRNSVPGCRTSRQI